MLMHLSQGWKMTTIQVRYVLGAIIARIDHIRPVSDIS